MNNLYNSLMAYRQSRGGMQRPQGQRPRLQGGMMGRPNTPSPTGGYDSSGINPGGGMPRPTPQASPMQMQPSPMQQAPQMPQPMGGMQQPQMPRPMPAPQAPAGGGYDSSGINPSAGRPFQLQGGFTSQRLPQSRDPILYNQMPGASAS